MGQKKGGRGRGHKQFVVSAEDLEKRNERHEASARARDKRRGEDDEDADSEEGSVEEVDESERRLQMDALRDTLVEKERKAKGPSVIETANPNAVKKHVKLKDMAAAPELSRREREEIEKQRAAEAYRKRHAEGKTDEYKKDMERLQEARKRREELAAAPKEEVAKKNDVVEEVAKKNDVVQADDDDDDDDDPKLDARTVKAMKPAQLKDALKKKGLSTQGQKKDLVDRLLNAI